MIKKIFQVSDIHIRNFKRHDEYRRVFEKLYNYIRENFTQEDLICLTGDIVHAKTDVTPELVEEVQTFLKSLADIGRVLLIPGNHDANLNNGHRMDALTPIVNALNHPNLTYLKKTEVLDIYNNNVTFYHWSVFDSHTEYPKCTNEGEDFKICLYHGPVSGTVTESGFGLFDNDVKVEDFEGFDLVLLGDIHKTQFLNEAKTIGYPGSLVQQNHAESLVHGIYVWDVATKSAEFVEIENDTAFYTIEVDAGVYQPLPQLPKNLYLRVKYRNTDQSEIKRIVAEIKQEHNVLETSLMKIRDFTTSSNENKKLNVHDVRDIDYQNSLLVDFLKEKYDLDEQSIKDICEINKIINNALPKSEVPRNSIWLPKTFEFSNMFSYGKGNFIDFSNMTGTYGIFAPNASGKSTLLDSIAYCIFDKCSRTTKSAQVMNSASDSFQCKLVFELNGLEYTIERKGSKQKLGNVKVNVDFYYVDQDGSKVSLNGKERNDTNKSIQNVMGTYEDFVLTALSMQNNNTGFIDMNQKDRKDLLSQFLDINVFEDLYNLANNEMKEVSVLLKEYQKQEYHELLKKAEFDVDTFEIKLEEVKDKRSEVEGKRDTKSEEILTATKELIKVDEDSVDIEELEGQKSAIEAGITKVTCSVSENNDQISLIQSKIAELNNKKVGTTLIKDINLEDYSHKLRSHKLDTEALQDKQLELSNANANLKNSLKKMEKLKELKYDPNCKFCMDNVFVKDAIETKNSIEAEQLSVKQLEETVELLEKRIKHWSSAIEIKDAKDKYEKDLQDLEAKKNKKEAEDNKLTKKLQDAQTLLTNIETKIASYYQQEEAITHNQTVNTKIAKLKEESKAINRELEQVNDEISDITANKKLEENNKAKYEQGISKLKDLETKFKDYQYYLQAVHRDGLPHKLIANIIPQVEEEINNILAQLVDFQVVLHADDKNINAYIAYDENNFWPLELTSGMEKFVASLAIRTSLINVSTLPRPNFMAIDEGFGALDQTNLSSMVMLFDYLKTQFKFIMIISHIDSMRDVVDHHIEINKVNGRSKIEQAA
jgi:DNA repair exonuclease SbcCD ATPase subunit/predicted phosphohydrolase